MKSSQFPRSLRTLAHQIRKGVLDPFDLCEYHLERVSRFNPSINALRFIDTEGARAKAKQCREDVHKGNAAGRLHGVFFCVKDHIDVQGQPRSEGTLLNAEQASRVSAVVVQRLIQEGAICLGKGNMAEYGKSFFTDNDAFGRTNNPFNTALTSGGSGGGDAAAVASHFVDFGIGVDLGGSIKVPANFCGVFGLCPSVGVIPTSGLSHSQHTVLGLIRSIGPLAHTLDDLEVLFGVLAGYDRDDHFSVPIPYSSSAPAATGRFAFFSEINGVSACAEIKSKIESTAKRFEAINLRGEEHTPGVFAKCFEPFVILGGQATLIAEDIAAAERGKPRQPTKEGPAMQHFRSRIAAELPALTVEGLLKTWHTLDFARSEVHALFKKYDFVLMPVAAVTAPAHGTVAFDVDGSKRPSQEVFQFAGIANVLGLPALAFPIGVDKNGVPLGLQIIGPRFSERELISILRSAGFTTAPVPKL